MFGVDRLTREFLTMRKIYLDVTNAGQDDGLPTSVLREVSHLLNLKHKNIIQIKEATVKNEAVFISFSHCKYNLREYIKQHGVTS